MSNLVKFDHKSEVALMDEGEKNQFFSQCVGDYATIAQLMDYAREPMCPHAQEDRVVTDFHGKSWASILERIEGLLSERVTEKLTICVRREPVPWLKNRSLGNYYNTAVFMAIHDAVSNIVARRARQYRQAVTADMINDEELQDIIQTKLSKYLPEEAKKPTGFTFQ